MNTKEVQQIVSQIKSSLFKNANSFSIGMLKSHFRGTGLKFKEHQVYSHGDDVRFIDWKMLAKTSNPYVKTFEEERNVVISVLIDCTQSMFMGYENKSKLEVSLEIVSLLYLLSASTNDYVETIICTGTKIIRIPKKKGEAGIVMLVSTLKNEGILNSLGKVNLAYKSDVDFTEEISKEVVREFYRKRELVLISDFYNFLTGKDLDKLTARKHVHAFRLRTPLDDADKFNYRIFATDFNSQKVKEVDTSTVKEIKSVIKKRYVKDLSLENRYLEDFVKEML